MGNVLKYKYIPATQRSSLILKIGLSTVVDDSFKISPPNNHFQQQILQLDINTANMVHKMI